MKLTTARKLGFVCVGLFTLPALGCEEEKPDPDLDRACEDLEVGHACTWIGSLEGEGYNGDDNHRTETMLAQPQDLLFRDDGTAWFSDFNNFLIRRIHEDGRIETMVGQTDPIFPGDGPFGGIPPEGGEGATWLLNHPTNLLEGADGNVLVVGWHNHKFLSIDNDGYVTVICGGGAGFAGDGMPSNMALFRQPVDASYDLDGNLYIADQANGRIRMLDTDGIVTSIAGDGNLPMEGVEDVGDGGPAIEAQFSWQRGSNPNPSGGILWHDGMLYVSDTERDAIRVIDLETGIIDAFAGTGEAGADGDGGPAIDAQLNAPRDLEIGPDGRLYFADTDNSKIRAIDLESGIIETVVGTGELGREDEEGLPADEVILRRPFGLAFDPDGNLYVLDTLNSRIVKVAQ